MHKANDILGWLYTVLSIVELAKIVDTKSLAKLNEEKPISSFINLLKKHQLSNNYLNRYKTKAIDWIKQRTAPKKRAKTKQLAKAA